MPKVRKPQVPLLQRLEGLSVDQINDLWGRGLIQKAMTAEAARRQQPVDEQRGRVTQVADRLMDAGEIAPVADGPLKYEDLAQMSAAEINARWPEVQLALAAGPEGGSE